MTTINPGLIRLDKNKRLFGLNIPLIGLTGGIATGKSTVANLLEQRGFPVINADILVKDVYRQPETMSFIKTNYPDVISGDSIMFPRLRERFFKDPLVKYKVETFIYARMPQAFMGAFKLLKGPKQLVYDVPLLFERSMEGLFDFTVLVYAPRKIQQARLMKRDGHLEPMAETILDQQVDIEDKRSKSDFIIENSGTEAELLVSVEQFLKKISP